jgi:hypothetical protein
MSLPLTRIALSIVLVVASSSGAGAVLAAGSHVKEMTLRESDLSVGFDRDFSHSIPRAQVIALEGSVMPGYVDGWQVEFTRVQGADSAVVTSSALRYSSSTRAHDAVVRAWARVAKRTGAKRLVVDRPLGSEARAYAYPTSGITFYSVIWRYKNVNGWILLAGLESLGVTAEQAAGLAVKQQRHVRAAI